MKKLLAVLILGFYLLLPTFLMQHVLLMNNHSMHKNDCPFMISIGGSCQTSFLNHFELSKSVFANNLNVVIFTLFVAIIALSLNRNLNLPLLFKNRLYFKHYKEKTLVLNQLLYSSGLLNPKAP